MTTTAGKATMTDPCEPSQKLERNGKQAIKEATKKKVINEQVE